jgi:hypothetical protein
MTRDASHKTRKRHLVPWAGWSNEKPGSKQRTVMLRDCGEKCFLGTRKSFPICKKNTCAISRKGIYAAYVRSRQYRRKSSKYYKIAKKARSHPLFKKV